MAANIIRIPHNLHPAVCRLMPTSTSRAQVVTQHAAKACLQQSHRRSSTIPRITPHWSACGVLMGSTYAEQAQCAEVKVSTLVPNSPAVHHSTSPDTSQPLAAATSIQHQHSSCSVQALAPAPGELHSATPSSQQTHTQHAGRWPLRPRDLAAASAISGTGAHFGRFYLFVGRF